MYKLGGQHHQAKQVPVYDWLPRVGCHALHIYFLRVIQLIMPLCCTIIYLTTLPYTIQHYHTVLCYAHYYTILTI